MTRAEDGFELWALECGRVERFPRGAIHAAVTDGSTVVVPFGFLACRGARRVVLVDCGFDMAGSGAAFATARDVAGWRPISEILGCIGIAAVDVTDVILTHAHWDHAGGLAGLPHAVIHLQARELTEWVRLLAGPPSHAVLSEAIDRADIAGLIELAGAGRLHLVDGDVAELVPGIELISAADTHTPGSQCVVIRDRHRGRWIAAGDCVMSRDNLTGLVPGVYSPIAGLHGSRERLFELYDRLLANVGGDSSRVIAVHDAATWEGVRPHPRTGLRVATLAGA